MDRKYVLFGVTALAVVVLDQLTKAWIVANLELWTGRIDVVDGLFQIVHYQNTGAAFGIGTNTPYAMHVFLTFTVVALAMMGWMVWKLPRNGTPWIPALVGLIFGGAVGNAIDRARFQAVTDFLRFYTENESVREFLRGVRVNSAEWPAFNVADSAIVVGIIAFFLQQLFQKEEPEAELSAEEIPEAADQKAE